MEDYGWPITSLLSLINEDNELPLLPTKPWCSSAGTEQREGCWAMCVCLCVCVCVRQRERDGEGERDTQSSE